jgi:putative transposon-encoded protein
MKKVKIHEKNELKISGIKGFFKRKVKPFGTSARVDCPKEYLGDEVYLVILKKNDNKKK